MSGHAYALATETVSTDPRDADVLALRRAFYEDGRISQEEAERLFELADLGASDADFAQFFVEALTDYTVRQAAPAGYVTEQKAGWVVGMMMRDGRISTACELAALVSIIETATLVPEQFALFALEAVKTAVLTGDGRVLGQGYLQPGVIGGAEVALIRRIITAAGGSDTIRVSRAEAEFLFDLNDAVAHSDNDPSWQALFCQSIANYLMAGDTYTPMSRERAAELETWVADREVSVTGFVGKLFSSAPDFAGFFRGTREPEKGLDPQDWYARENEREAAEIQGAEQVTKDEAEWLVARIGRDGVLHANEIALLEFIKANSPSVHKKLHVLFGDLRPWKGQ